MTSSQTFSVLSEVTESWPGYLSGDLMTLGLLRRILSLQLFTWPVGNVNSCLSSGPGPSIETEECVLQKAVIVVYDP